MASKKCNSYDCAIKIINAIKHHLCQEDEDYDKPIISPKFLNNCLDLMFLDDFEKEEVIDNDQQRSGA